ncbi:hypothetical protein GETHLI_06150 [Geothrix limicola]|uniref:histidine kinase n=2 Tax=Geothrix limicola TaxID=2927978 RepID=A0ABQ5QBR4_9BACT|nr:hypothetical protein GETHLI_06150 [Geothrix limicola]
MAAFGWLVSGLPPRLVQPAVGLGLGLSNLVAFAFLVVRAREPGPEQRGWLLLTLSFLGVMGSNAVLLFTPSPLIEVSTAERLYFLLQLVIALMQAWALLSWPLQTSARTSHRYMNLLGCLIFGCSLFLVLWTTALFQELDHGQWPLYVRMMGLGVRVAIVGGVVTYLLADDPRRVRGPVGWIFLAAVATVTILVLLRPYLFDARAMIQPSPFFGMVVSAPLSYVAAAWLRAPVEVPEEAPRLRFPMVDGLLYLPFIAAGGVLIASDFRRQNHFPAPLAGFMTISALMLVRQFLLIRAVRNANEKLEERVLSRTRSLEDLQRIMLRNERMNALGLLGAGLTHDLNNAITGIRGCAELARMQVEEGETPSVSDLDRILVAADQSAALTGRLMAFARQEEEVLGSLELVEEVSSLEPILRMLLTRKLSLKLDLGEGPIRIRGSRPQIEQILVNLVGNARDAMPKGGLISLRVWLDDQAVPPVACLEVSDTGEGMPPEVQAHIFEPFFTTKIAGKGTGLGLASVRYLMEEAGGSIQVDSQPGLGSRFTLRFAPAG